MDYTGNLCPGCNTVFTDGDDVVVCPECGTPQHRECYEKENRCVNSDKHAEGYVWQGVVKQTPVQTKKRETVTCPNCGALNPKESDVCLNCGMKFTLFGKNVVAEMYEQENAAANPNSDIPDYKAPFTLGVGEGFDADESEKEAVAAEFVKTVFSNMLDEKLKENSEENQDKRIRFEGPFPDSDEIDGVKTNAVGTFIGQNALSYISKFKKIQSGSKLSFNFAAFFLTPYWFFYRKLYKAGILFMTAGIAISILAIPSSLEFMEYMEGLAATLPASAEALTDAQLTEITNGMFEMMKPTFIIMFANILLHLICGFSANHIYKRYVIKNAAFAERLPDKKIAIPYIVKNGGASILIAMAAFFAQELLSVAISYLL